MEFHITKTIQAPLAHVFGVFMDIAKFPDYFEDVVRVDILSKQKSGQGTRWRETLLFDEHEDTVEREIHAFKLNQSYTIVTELPGVEYHDHYRFTAQDDSTIVEQHFIMKPLSLVARLMAPVEYLLRDNTKKGLEQNLNSLKTICERES